MRLLHVDHSERLVSTDFRGKTIPPYAILSHRWGDSEVLLEDIRNNTYKEKKGYRKIDFCAKQAALDQLQHFWIDTCCIDKWNLDELSKAINSMFRWYKNARKCYVFLPDVSVSIATEIVQQSDWEASFRASQWFTRGWTLQELIAPVSVEFFSSEGRRIGDKRSLEQLIHEITSIPVEALQNCPLDGFTISERLKWAENRETTEEEDKVYCLLGILDILMPTSYGEGKEKAWRRLQIEVEAASSAPSIIPFSQNNRFVGREPQLAELEARLFGGNQTTMMAITGPAGTGKSQLALELAYKTRQKNKRCSVFWIDASDMDSLYRSYASIAQKLDVCGWDDEKADIKQLVKLHLSRESARQWLLIFDSTNDINLGSSGVSTAQAANLINYLPQSELCSIIFTTTNSDIAKRLASENIVELGEMAPDTAQRMLENYLDTSVSRSEQQEARLLLQELSYLPLAIVQAAAYINTRNITLQNYRSQLVRQKEEALEHSNEMSANKLHEYGTKCPVATTLLISMDQIRSNDSLAADYLFLAACVDRKDIPVDLLEASSPREREDAIKILNSYALITRRPAESALDLHQLVHRALRGWLQKQERLDQWTQQAIARLLRVFPGHNHGSRSKWRRLLPHAKYALSHSLPEQEGADRMTLVWKCAMALLSDGRNNESEELFVQVIETRKKVLGNEHPDTLTSMANLASTYRNQGRWKKAEELQSTELQICKRVLGDEHPDTLTSMANLALTYSKQGRWKEAERLEVQVMETRKRVLGEDHPDTLVSMGNLATTYGSQGRWNEAEKMFVQELETSKRVLGSEHPHTLTSMENLASTYRNQGRWKEAEELELEVVEARKNVLGSEHPDTLKSMTNLATTYKNQGRWKDAEALFVQATETSKRVVLGSEHPDTLTSMTNLATTYSNQGRWKEAGELLVQVTETSKRVVGPEHPSTLSNMANLASTYCNQGRWKEAEKLFVQVIETGNKVLGDDHPDTLVSMGNLAATYGGQGRWKEAEELFVQVIETRKRVLGDEHPATLSDMINLASTYRNQGQWKKAEGLEVQVMGMSAKVLGAEHPDTLRSMANLASTYWNQRRWKEAEGLEVQVMEVRKRLLGAEHPDTLVSIGNLAMTYGSQGRWKEAEELFVPKLEISKRVLGSEHPHTLTSMANLASMYKNQGRWKEAEELELEVMETRKKVLGEEHPSTLTSIANLAHTLKSQSRNDEAISLMEKCFELQKRILGPHHLNTETSLEALNRWRMENLEIRI
ncbi:kinesin light chain 3 [Lepidopterella palustris CBS 459.81]|uniref:Kinesin light chain 3 n=1 Tax=Lepidopterella palustris CBS 459.81 TaxID=1314670 RepID=A0A8E2DY99_9PEZI|nr:kinesin light chain 3 [Lepidopterella palustris CBS 459.81]